MKGMFKTYFEDVADGGREAYVQTKREWREAAVEENMKMSRDEALFYVLNVSIRKKATNEGESRRDGFPEPSPSSVASDIKAQNEEEVNGWREFFCDICAGGRVCWIG